MAYTVIKSNDTTELQSEIIDFSDKAVRGCERRELNVKLNLNFTLYKGKTKLSDWWQEIKKHFTAVQDAINELDAADTDLAQSVTQEMYDRQNSDLALRQAVDDLSRQKKDLDERLSRDISDMCETITMPDEGGTYYASDTESLKAIPSERLFKLFNDTGEPLSAIQTGSYVRQLSYPLKPEGEAICLKSDIGGKAEIIVLCSELATLEDITLALQNYYTSAQVDSIAESLRAHIDDGQAGREAAEEKLAADISSAASKITAETAERKAADSALNERINPLESVSHTHENKQLLDTIDIMRIREWDSVGEKITEEQLGGAVAAEAEQRANGDSENKSYIEFLEQICFGFSEQLQNIYAAMGCIVYDGGLFGAPDDGTELNGGEFGEAVGGTVDCGDFEPFLCGVSDGVPDSVINGGTF